MRLGTVKSDLIAKIGFSAGPGQVGTMRVEYRDGVTFDYLDVPYKIFASIIRTKSPAKLLSVRDQFKFKEV